MLLRDGNATQGSLARAALACRVPGVRRASAGVRRPGSLRVAGGRAAVGDGLEDVPLEVVVDSNHADQGTLDVFRDGQSLKRETVELAEGENRFRLRVPTGTQPRTVFVVRLTVGQDTFSENNLGRAAVFAAARRRSCWWPPSRPRSNGCGRRCRGWATMRRTSRPAGCRTRPGAWARTTWWCWWTSRRASCRRRLPPPWINTSTKLGGGLIVMGGDKTFAAAAYRDTRLEKLLPVKAADAVALQKQSVAGA